MENEIWKDVIGYEGKYQVSDFGNAKSLNYKRTGKERILKLAKTHGYPTICLWEKGKPKMRSIHSLVAESFIDANYRSKKLVVNHKNFKRDDNRLSNLEVVTTRENTNQKHLKSSSKYTGVCWNKKNKKWESCISIKGHSKHLGNFNSEKEASEYYEAALDCAKNGRVDEIKTKERKKTSIYRFISFDAKKNKWKVLFTINSKRVYLGGFNTEQEAYSALCTYNGFN